MMEGGKLKAESGWKNCELLVSLERFDARNNESQQLVGF